MQSTFVAIQMKNVIAVGDKSENVVFLKQLCAVAGRHFPLGLSHPKDPALHIGNISFIKLYAVDVPHDR